MYSYKICISTIIFWEPPKAKNCRNLPFFWEYWGWNDWKRSPFWNCGYKCRDKCLTSEKVEDDEPILYIKSAFELPAVGFREGCNPTKLRTNLISILRPIHIKPLSRKLTAVARLPSSCTSTPVTSNNRHPTISALPDRTQRGRRSPMPRSVKTVATASM